jgi:hypothetical protein
MGSEGFLQDPSSKETKRFHRDEKSWLRDPKVFGDTGIPIPAEPPLLKTRVHLGSLCRAVKRKGGWGRFAAVSIRKRGSEISVVFQELWIQRFSDM